MQIKIVAGLLMIFSKEICLLCGTNLTDKKIGNKEEFLKPISVSYSCPITTKDRSLTNTHAVDVPHYQYSKWYNADYYTVEIIINPYKLIFSSYVNTMNVLYVSLIDANKFMFSLPVPKEFNETAIRNKIQLLTPFC